MNEKAVPASPSWQHKAEAQATGALPAAAAKRPLLLIDFFLFFVSKETREKEPKDQMQPPHSRITSHRLLVATTAV